MALLSHFHYQAPSSFNPQPQNPSKEKGQKEENQVQAPKLLQIRIPAILSLTTSEEEDFRFKV
jgi:hypothetical protein